MIDLKEQFELEATHRYGNESPCREAFLDGVEAALSKEAHIAGVLRQPTEEEIKAACLAIMPYVIAQPSQEIFDFLTKATGAYPGQEIVRKVIDAMREKATEE